MPARDKTEELALYGVYFMIQGDTEGFAGIVDEMVALGPAAVHVVLASWAGVALHDAAAADPEGFWGLEAVDTRTGEVVSADMVDGQPGGRALKDAMRIVVAHANHDPATIDAIISAASDDPDDLAQLIIACARLAAMAAQSMKDGDE